MMLVRVITKYWSDLMSQTPDNSGVWDGIKFTLEPVENCDYLIVIDRVYYDTVVNCPQENIWAIIQEPPIPRYRWLRKGFRSFNKVYTQDIKLQGNKYIHSQPALPWHVGKNYDFLQSCSIPNKHRVLSFITSNKAIMEGHRKRLAFLEKIENSIEFDLFGQGFNPIDSKWEGLADYKYSLAIENYSGQYYWTEKLADCFLCYTMQVTSEYR